MSDNHLTNNLPKAYPAATPEVASIFGMPISVPSLSVVSTGVDPSRKEGFGAAPEQGKGLFAEGAGIDLSPVLGAVNQNGVSANLHGPDYNFEPASADRGAAKLNSHVFATRPGPATGGNKVLNMVKAVTPYVVVFTVALFVYLYFFSGVNFNFSQTPKSQAEAQTPKQNSLARLQQQNLAGYQQWIGQFYYDVSDSSILDPNADNSGNGLSNFQKYLLNLNPKSYDTMGLGMSDSDALQAGINPTTGTKLTADQRAIVDTYFDFEVISNRQTLAQLQKSGEVAGAQTASGNFGFGAPMVQAATNSSAAQNQTANAPASQQLNGGNLDINQSVPGRLRIPSLKIDVPLIWSSDPKNFDTDLQSGVIHYPGTALPGETGTSYLSGHSSNYVWAKGNYNQVFTQLDKLADNTSFSITVTANDGKTHVLHYVVVGRQQYSPNDQAQFQNNSQSVVALSTCWPVGSTKYRLVVFGQLTQIEN